MAQTTKQQVFTDFINSLSTSLGVEDPKIIRYKNDPNLFFKEKLGVEFWDKLQDVANDISGYDPTLLRAADSGTGGLQNPVTVKPVRRLSVVAGHGVSKSFFAAALTLWYLYTHNDCLVVTTAGRYDQVEKVVWKEVNTLFLKARQLDPIFLGAKTKCNFTELRVSSNRLAYGTTADPSNPETVRGLHSPNILIICDEASGIDDKIFGVLEGAMSGESATLLLLSNPGQQSGYFYKSFSNPLFKNYHLSVVDMVDYYKRLNKPIPGGLSGQTYIDDQKEMCGEHSALYQMKVLGRFASLGMGNTVITPSLFDANIKQNRPSGKFQGERRLGIDVALMGNDSCVFVVTDDLGIVEIRKYQHLEPFEIRKYIHDIALQYSIVGENIVIDSTGLGSTFASDYQNEYGVTINPVNFAESPMDKDEYCNISTEMYFQIRKRLMVSDEKESFFHLNYEGINPEFLDDMRLDLCDRLYDIRKQAFILEPKKDFKKRIGRSPDIGDALALALYDNSQIAFCFNLGLVY